MSEAFGRDVFCFRLWYAGPGLQLKSPRSYWPFSKREGYVKPILRIGGYALFYVRPLIGWGVM